MTQSSWQHCRDGFVGVEKYQSLLKDTVKTLNRKDDRDIDAPISNVITPDRKCKVSKRKRTCLRTQSLQKDAFGQEHLPQSQSQFLSGFEDFNHSVSHHADDIEWSSSSSDDDKAIPDVQCKKTDQTKRRCLFQKANSVNFVTLPDKHLEEGHLKRLEEQDSVEIDLVATPPELSTSCNESHNLIETSTKRTTKLLKKNLPTNIHSDFKIKTNVKKKARTEFKHQKESQDLFDLICDVASESDNESEKDCFSVRVEEESSESENIEQQFPDSLEVIESSGVSSNSSTQADIIRASDWIVAGQKQKTPVKINAPNSEQEQDSTKKKKKYLKNTLAGRLNQIITWEKSSIRFWYHSIEAGMADVSKKKSKTLKIMTLKSQFSVHITNCVVIGSHEICTAIFSKQTVSKLTLKPGMIVQIFPPWQELNESNEKKLLCTNLVKMATTLEQTDSLEHSVEVNSCLSINLTWQCLCSTEKSMSAASCTASKHPVAPPFHFLETSSSSPSIRLHSVTESCPTSQTKRTFVESMERTTCEWECLPTFQATVLRCLQHTQGKGRKMSHQLLLEDAAGSVMLFTIPDNYPSTGTMYKLEGQKCLFSGLSLVTRTNKDKQPDLFTLVDLVWKEPDVQISQYSSEFSESQHQHVAKCPDFAYLLESPCVGNSQFNIELVDVPEDVQNLELTNMETIQQATIKKRISFVAKIVDGRKKIGSSSIVYVFDDLCDINNITNLVCLEISNSCVFNSDWSIAFFRDVWCEQGKLYADSFTTILSTSTSKTWNLNINNPSIWERIQSTTLHLPMISASSPIGSFVRAQGVITSIDDTTAYSWEECDHCGSDQLVTLPDSGSIFCNDCNQKVGSPEIKMKMEAFVQIMKSNMTVKIDFSQRTIQTLLPTDEADDEGYDVEQVINQSICCPVCLVQEIISDNKSNCTQFSLLELNYYD